MTRISKLPAILAVFVGTTSSNLASSQSGRQDVLIHSYSPADAGFDRSLRLQGSTPIGLENRVSGVLERLHDRVTVKSRTSGVFSLVDRNIRTNSYSFELDGISFCQFQMKAHESVNGAVTVLGSMPNVVIDEQYQLNQWPSVQDSLDVAEVARFENGISEPFSIVKKRACLWVEDGEIIRAWELTLKSGKLNYKAIADDSTVYEFQNKFFHADGTARVYSTNPVDGELTDYTVTNLQPDDSGQVLVENDKFITLLDTDEYSYFADLEAPYEFITSPSEEEFKEISLFTNANRALDWLESQGYQNFGSAAIRVVVHASFGGDTNNALYQPGDDFSTIYVGDGDGSILQNLSVDYDVVAHEIGHHVVYHSIKDIKNESLVLHEGLADFFTYAKTGNACLGESICPSTSGICAIPNQCLRTAENTYSYTSADLPSEAHLRSQFISGYLWDLITIDGISTDTVTQIVLQAIDLFVKDSGYTHFILGLMMVDESSFAGQYCDTIYNRAIERGLAEKITDYDCSNIATLVADSGGSLSELVGGDTSSSTEENSSSSSKTSWCGSIGLSEGSSGLSIILLVGLPLILWTRKRTVAPDETNQS
ncbi:hypothetical protein [Pseudobacteriovorax antillogorgiicola]|uniref:Thermolysin metallopeptidase, catalytic domain n=1 Tax=Pseudobacteriovorax antillogorgiicola TaxID=1513793 RepID=A0A1Y6CHC8_9BACT|nr:hypothetical protein [Pseudobacteriovorax antillogorgiicola]TCS48683.1 thermolysin metallopeptidase-like protein [Pseudobacteriovorax antillogorgiicola]SMF54854.1 Thermolysin metallopeptidase, catalytic domain [Pseudobacteriovorax antillogorgiicola]